MGTDIHMVVETKVYCPDTREDLGWQLVPGPIIDCWSCRGEGVVSRENRPHAKEEWLAENLGKPCSCCVEAPDEDEDDRVYFGMRRVSQPGKIRDEWFGDRDYTVFAVLANVRNGSGFAGVRTHAPIEPISLPRGLPDDMCEEARAYFEHAGYHDDSWVMLEEVLRYNWDQPVHRTGVFDIGKDCERFLSRMRELAAVVGETPTRLVFNFDS